MPSAAALCLQIIRLPGASDIKREKETDFLGILAYVDESLN